MPSTERPWRQAIMDANAFQRKNQYVRCADKLADAALLMQARIANLEAENASLREQLHPTKEGPLSGDPKGLA